MCAEIISFNAELSPPIYGLPATMQRIIREVSEKRQAAIDFALGPALGAASIAIGSRIVLNAYGYSNRLNLWIMMIGRSTANKTAPMKDILTYVVSRRDSLSPVGVKDFGDTTVAVSRDEATIAGFLSQQTDDAPDCAELIDKLADMDMVAYAGRSVGGNGVFAIVPIAYPEKHVQQWESLRRYFDSLGITVDPQTKDVARLRICSYDPEARVRFDAVPYKGVYTPPQPKPVTANRYYGSDETEARVSECCQQIASYHTDLTNDYTDWLRLGFALAELGEAGRGYFHTVSSQNQKYDREKCDRKFSECLRTASRCGIGYFFNRCKEYGITYKTERYESE